MNEIATAIGSGKLASYNSVYPGDTTGLMQTRISGPSTVIRAKGSGDGWKILAVAEGAAESISVSTYGFGSKTANKANSVGQVDYARASSKQGTASATGSFVNIPFAIDSVGLAVNPTDAVAKIPFTGLGNDGDAATVASIKAVFRCSARYVYLNNEAIGAVDTAAASSTLTKATHGFVVGDTFTVSAASAGFSTETKYYVKTVPTANTFTASATKGGIALTASSTAGISVTKTSGTYNSLGATAGGAPTGTTAYEITPLIPGYGSGTASYFIGKIGHTEAEAFPSGAANQSCIKRKMLDNTTNIQEHSGASVAERENAIGIYSIGQWAAQTNSAITGATPKTEGTVLLNLYPTGADMIPATTGAGVTLAPNENWLSDLKRVVYNIVSYRKATTAGSPIREMFVGTTSLVCQQRASIVKMGFTPLSSTDPSNVNSCGSIAAGNRTNYSSGSNGTSVLGASISQLSSTVGAIGRDVTATVKVGTSMHQQGGTVVVTNNSTYGAEGATVLGSQVVAADVAGDADTTIEIAPAVVGSTALYAYFVPALGGVIVEPLKAAGTSDVWTQNIVVPSTSKTFLSVKKPAKIGGSVRVIATIDSGVFPGGTVTLKNAATEAPLATDTLDEGESAAYFSVPQSAATMAIKAVYVPKASSGAIGSTSKTSTWSLEKIAPSVAVVLAAAPNGLVAGVNPVFAVATRDLVKAVVAVPATDLFTLKGHGLVAGNKVTFASSTTAPTGLDKVTTYYVIAATTDAFSVSRTLGGAKVDFTTAGATVKVNVANPAPNKITTTVTSSDASVTLKPTGNVKVYYGAGPNIRTAEITVTGATLSNGVATVVLDHASLWAAVGAVTATATTGKYLTIVYGGDDVFSNTGTPAYITKQVGFKSN